MRADVAIGTGMLPAQWRAVKTARFLVAAILMTPLLACGSSVASSSTSTTMNMTTCDPNATKDFPKTTSSPGCDPKTTQCTLANNGQTCVFTTGESSVTYTC